MGKQGIQEKTFDFVFMCAFVRIKSENKQLFLSKKVKTISASTGALTEKLMMITSKASC